MLEHERPSTWAQRLSNNWLPFPSWERHASRSFCHPFLWWCHAQTHPEHLLPPALLLPNCPGILFSVHAHRPRRQVVSSSQVLQGSCKISHIKRCIFSFPPSSRRDRQWCSLMANCQCSRSLTSFNLGARRLAGTSSPIYPLHHPRVVQPWPTLTQVRSSISDKFWNPQTPNYHDHFQERKLS